MWNKLWKINSYSYVVEDPHRVLRNNRDRFPVSFIQGLPIVTPCIAIVCVYNWSSSSGQ